MPGDRRFKQMGDTHAESITTAVPDGVTSENAMKPGAQLDSIQR
ncbi:hypothetical protein MPS_0827 [Mycobacterium pseudoshottsii JCM 15466]|nr:hypothetical protein MPS_0827 [Mycobacterium pseudoshottsii JCM 15466]